MKFIDKRGMVFGKINIIDLMVVIFFLCLTPIIYFGWKLFHRPQSQPTTIEIPIKEYEELKTSNEGLRTKVKDFCREHKRASICK